MDKIEQCGHWSPDGQNTFMTAMIKKVLLRADQNTHTESGPQMKVPLVDQMSTRTEPNLSLGEISFRCIMRRTRK